MRGSTSPSENAPAPAAIPITLKRHLVITLQAALFGSVAGSLIYVAYSLYGHPHRLPPPDPGLTALMLPLVIVVSLFGTLPGALLVALPAYPLRRMIAARPILWALPMSLLGLGLGAIFCLWAFHSASQGYGDLEILWSFSGATGLGFPVALGGWARRVRRDLAAFA